MIEAKFTEFTITIQPFSIICTTFHKLEALVKTILLLERLSAAGSIGIVGGVYAAVNSGTESC
jgi:hypothetical protein